MIYEWNVTARAVVVLKEPRRGAPVPSHFERHDDVFVTVRVGLTSWVQVRIQHAGRPQTGFLLEQDLLHPVGIPAPAESKNFVYAGSIPTSASNNPYSLAVIAMIALSAPTACPARCPGAGGCTRGWG